MKDKCAVKKCKNIATMTFLEKRICGSCWNKHCNPKTKFNLKEILKVKDQDLITFI